MKKVFLIIIILAVAIVLRSYSSITGFVLGAADVNITERLQGRITALDYSPTISITDTQNITIEFTNTGSVPISTARIEETIYFYNVTKLDPVAYYYDSSVQLMPGMRRSFRSVFVPPYYGTYYIKARVPYETRVTESWGVFSVTYTLPPPPPPIIIVVPPTTTGEITYIIQEAGTPKLTADYQKNYNLYPGQSLLISVVVKNTGETILYNLRMSTSTTNLILTDVNPKVLSSLSANKSNIFLISLTVPKNTPTGVYPLNFEILSDKTMEFGFITLNVTGEKISIKDDVYQTILNYDYLVSELEKKISDAISEGVDVTMAQKSFDRAKEGLKKAKDFYDAERYEEARDKLDEIKKDFEDTVFRLANAAIKVYVAPAFSPLWIVVLIIAVGIIFLFYLRTREKKKRPKLLREVSEET